ncbi:hypothetical protein N181_11480 [Sinorhizobium fredii USDA 205]|nr:hypothetical protein N181_11480 [Sinorhizobium fredii USDA 205]
MSVEKCGDSLAELDGAIWFIPSPSYRGHEAAGGC